MIFELDAWQKEKLGEWVSIRRRRNTGAIGGQFTYSFTPTNLGTVVKVECGITKEQLDLTDYDAW